jgi:ribosomal protein S11
MQEHKKEGSSYSTTPNFFLTHHFLSKHNVLRGDKELTKKEKPNFFDFGMPSKESITSSKIIYVHSTKRNTRVSFCDSQGVHLFSLTMGSLGNKKSKRGNVYFIKDLCMKFLQELEKYKFDSFILCINGFGRSRRPILRFFSKTKLRYKCSYIIDVTTKSHNGCRSRITRRL